MSGPVAAPTGATGAAPGARQRMLDAAERLFAARGVHGVSGDTVIAEAGVAKASFYKHFPSKADLVAAVLADDARALELYRTFLGAGGGDHAGRVAALFDGLDDLVTDPAWRGCRWANAGLALGAEPGHPAHGQVRRHKDGVRDLLLHEARGAAVADPEAVADQLLVLVEGVLATGALRSAAHPGRAVRPLARSLVDPGPGQS